MPGLGYDWMNYGGINRDVLLIETSLTHIDDYFIQLKKGSSNEVDGWVQLDSKLANQKVDVIIPELNINYSSNSDSNGRAEVSLKAKLSRWSPTNR